MFDEWQDAPKIWGAIRKYIDDTGLNGQFILTGSSSKDVDVAHTGTLKIAQLKMYPMSLYETGESNGTVSLAEGDGHIAFIIIHKKHNYKPLKIYTYQLILLIYQVST